MIVGELADAHGQTTSIHASADGGAQFESTGVETVINPPTGSPGVALDGGE